MGSLSSAASFLLALPSLVDSRNSAEVVVVSDIGVLSRHVEVCKCERMGDFAWACDSSPLAPSKELNVCVKSASPDVRIDEISTMVVTGGSTDVGFVATPGIDDMAYVYPENGAAASVFIPSNVFNYVAGYIRPKNGVVASTSVPAGSFDYAAGAFIDIAGTFEIQLAGSARKHCMELIDAGVGCYPFKKKSYELKVYLQDEAAALEEGRWMDGYGTANHNRDLSLLGIPFLFAAVVWYWNRMTGHRTARAASIDSVDAEYHHLWDIST